MLNQFVVGEIPRGSRQGNSMETDPAPRFTREEIIGIITRCTDGIAEIEELGSTVRAPVCFFIPRADLANFLRDFEKTRSVLRQDGLWLAQVQPYNLRIIVQMARRFITHAKSNNQSLKGFYLEVIAGFLTWNGVPLIPAYMIPSDQDKWVCLQALLAQWLNELRRKPWSERHNSVCNGLRDFQRAWARIAALSLI